MTSLAAPSLLLDTLDNPEDENGEDPINEIEDAKVEDCTKLRKQSGHKRMNVTELQAVESFWAKPPLIIVWIASLNSCVCSLESLLQPTWSRTPVDLNARLGRSGPFQGIFMKQRPAGAIILVRVIHQSTEHDTYYHPILFSFRRLL